MNAPATDHYDIPKIKRPDVEFYYVAYERDEKAAGGQYTRFLIQASPFFRTEQEVRDFHNKCDIPGSYCVQSTFLARDEAEALDFESKHFGGQ